MNLNKLLLIIYLFISILIPLQNHSINDPAESLNPGVVSLDYEDDEIPEFIFY